MSRILLQTTIAEHPDDWDIRRSHCWPGNCATPDIRSSRATGSVARCDDQDNPDIAWPNFHSGANGDYQPVLDGETTSDGRRLGRALAASTFHHFADYNWDLGYGAPSFVTEAPGTGISEDPYPLLAFKDYVRNIAEWLSPSPPISSSSSPVAKMSPGFGISTVSPRSNVTSAVLGGSSS